MKAINKIFSEIEDVVYSSNNKQEADEIINGYQKLFNIVNFDNYKLSIQKSFPKLIIKHKAFANKIYLYYSKHNYYIEDQIIELSSINDILPTYFIITLDKKEQ